MRGVTAIGDRCWVLVLGYWFLRNVLANACWLARVGQTASKPWLPRPTRPLPIESRLDPNRRPHAAPSRSLPHRPGARDRPGSYRTRDRGRQAVDERRHRRAQDRERPPGLPGRQGGGLRRRVAERRARRLPDRRVAGAHRGRRGAGARVLAGRRRHAALVARRTLRGLPVRAPAARRFRRRRGRGEAPDLADPPRRRRSGSADVGPRLRVGIRVVGRRQDARLPGPRAEERGAAQA